MGAYVCVECASGAGNGKPALVGRASVSLSLSLARSLIYSPIHLGTLKQLGGLYPLPLPGLPRPPWNEL